MTLQEIKDQLNVSSLPLNKTEDPAWTSCFINDTRTSILMPTELAENLAIGVDADLVLVPKGTRTSKKSKAEYTLFIIIEQKADYML